MSPDKSFGDIISEVRIIKQQVSQMIRLCPHMYLLYYQLRHPNIVRYRRIFVENQRLYIVMDLIDGVQNCFLYENFVIFRCFAKGSHSLYSRKEITVC